MKHILFVLFLMLCWAAMLQAQWSVRHIDATAPTYESTIRFLDDSIGLYMGSNSVILRSEDAGETWNAVDIEARINVREFQFINDSVIHAVGYRIPGTGQELAGKIIRSEDRGNTWHHLVDLSGKQLMTLWYFDNDTGLVAGSGGVCRTVDSGTRWDTVWSFHQSGYITGDLKKLCFPSEQVGYAVGQGVDQDTVSSLPFIDQLLLKTSDAGLTWDTVRTFPHHLITIHFTSQDTGYIGTESGMVLKTTDGGNIWDETQVSVSHSAVKAIHFSSPSTGFATGSPADYPTNEGWTSFFIAKTIDGGDSWVSYDTTGIPLTSIHFLNDSIGFVSGWNGLIMKSEGKIDRLPDDYPWHLGGGSNIMSYQPVLNSDSTSWDIAFMDMPGMGIRKVYAQKHPDSIYAELYSFTWDGPHKNYDGKIREDTISGKLWYIPPPAPPPFTPRDEEILIMDLTLDVGDTFDFSGHLNTVDSVYFSEDGRKIIRFEGIHIASPNYWNETIRFIEGVGPNSSVIWYIVGLDAYVTCKYDNDELVYVNTNSMFDGCLPLDTGISPELINGCSMILYPNPAKDILHVDIDHSLMPTTEIIIYNVQGVALKHKHLHGYNHTISLGDLSKGLYFVSIKNGPHHLRRKILIN